MNKAYNMDNQRQLHTKSRGVQTDYREADTQTDPYSPPYILPSKDAYPKVLALIHLTWGHGLPPSVQDVVTIEQALARRMSELRKDVTDEKAEFLRNAKMKEELEAQMWLDRDRELERVMNQKIEIMKKLYEKLKQQIADVNLMKLQDYFDSQKAKYIKITDYIRNKYLRQLRSLEKKYCRSKISKVDRIISCDCCDPYKSEDLKVRPPPPVPIVEDYDTGITTQFEIFDQITSTDAFKKKYLDFDCKALTKCYIKTKLNRRDQCIEKRLGEAFSAFRAEALRKPYISTKTLHSLNKNQTRRVPTPQITGPSLEEDKEDQAIIFLQKTIRGRAVQSMIREEMQSNEGVLGDMKALHKMDPNGRTITLREIQTIQLMEKEREAQLEKQNEISEITDQLEGETLGRQLDFLEKEMVRLQDERKICALVTLAERERRMREAVEAGLREQEEDERRVNDEIFRRVVGIQQGTVDMFLEDVYLKAIERTADDNARIHVHHLAKTVNEAAYMLKNNGLENIEESTAELVYDFVLPEVNRICQRQRMEYLTHRYIRASDEATNCSTAATEKLVHDIIQCIESRKD